MIYLFIILTPNVNFTKILRYKDNIHLKIFYTITIHKII